MGERRLLYLLTLVGLLVFYGAYQQWTAWILLLTALLFPWLSLALSLPAMVRLRMVPGVTARMEQGQREAAVLLRECSLPYPPTRGRILVTRPLTGEKWVLLPGDALPTDHCGTLMASPHRGKVYDYLGLFRGRVRNVTTAASTVFPKPVEMPVPPDLTRYLSCRWRPKFGGGYAENHELRLYRPGDNLNQVHWKLSAKTGKLILREPMEPELGLILLTMDIRGTAEELDRKFGKLLWLSRYLLGQGVRFEIRAMAADGLQSCPVANETDLDGAMAALLGCAPAASESVRELEFGASWQYHIGGDGDET